MHSTSEVDAWFRAEGLPSLVPIRRWATDLPRRTAPLIAFIAALAVCATVLLVLATQEFDTPVTDEALAEDAGTNLLVTLILTVFLSLPLLVTGVVRRVLRRSTPRTATTLSWLIIALSVAAMVAAGRYGLGESWPTSVRSAVQPTAVAFLLIWLGAGALVSWTVRSAVRNLAAVRSMASIALPVILTLVIFTFFSTEAWQITDTLPVSRLFGVGLLMTGIAVLVVLPVALTALRSSRAELTSEDRLRLAASTTLTGVRGAVGEVRAEPLSRLQRGNVLLVMITTQLLLGVIFAAVLAALLVVLGNVALTPETVRAWLGHDAPALSFGEFSFPASANLLKVAIFLAMISALTFVISTASDQQYREHFFEPMVAQVNTVLSVYDLAQAAAPQPEPPGYGLPPETGTPETSTPETGTPDTSTPRTSTASTGTPETSTP